MSTSNMEENVEDGESAISSQSENLLQPVEENSGPSSGLKNTLHGNVFQLKLLMLFLIRGINEPTYKQFKLGTEVPGQGGKFDDLIFKYEDESGKCHYRYLQAKHKQDKNNEDTITAVQLFNDSDGDFSLSKYFRSYRRDIITKIKNNGILDDCTICTNIGFGDLDVLKQNGIELQAVESSDKILDFQEYSKLSLMSKEKSLKERKVEASRFKLKPTDLLVAEMKEWSDIHLLAKTLLEYAVVKKKQLNLGVQIFKTYHVTLVREKVISMVYEEKKRKRKNSSPVKFTGEGMLNVDFVKGKISCAKLIQFRNILAKLTLEHLQPNKLGTSGKKRKIDDQRVTTPDLYDSVFIQCWKDLKFKLSDSVEKSIPESIRNRLISSSQAEMEEISLDDDSSRAEMEENSLEDFVSDDDIKGFLDTLVFAVNTPNEVQLSSILTKEVGHRYNLLESDFQSNYILVRMLDWFKLKESPWCSSEDGEALLRDAGQKMESLRVTAVSIAYRDEKLNAFLFRDCSYEFFRDEELVKMAETLEPYLKNPQATMARITSESPTGSAAKVIAALRKVKDEARLYHSEDSYLVTPSSHIPKQENQLRRTMCASQDSHRLLVIVCDNNDRVTDDQCQKLITDENGVKKNKVIIVIGREKNHKNSNLFSPSSLKHLKDDISFGQLSEISQETLLSLKVSFQGEHRPVRELIGCCGEVDQVIDRQSIEELMFAAADDKGNIKEETMSIPFGIASSSRFEKEMYIERKLRSAVVWPLDLQFRNELANELGFSSVGELDQKCSVNSSGTIKWSVESKEQSRIWTKMASLLEKRNKASITSLSENEICLLTKEDSIIATGIEDSNKQTVTVIAGVAGTGKSTILSRCYDTIKETNADYWVIKINLKDISRHLLNVTSVDRVSAIKFFVNNLPFLENNKCHHFVRSLLRHRLETSDRIVLMLDGFDELDSHRQETAVQLMKAIVPARPQQKSIRLFVTTRAHMVDDLQFQLSQLAYTLENFDKKDQVNCLTLYWRHHLRTNKNKGIHNEEEDKHLTEFAETLVDQVSGSLKDNERSFIGIPLQCRILAECFQDQLETIIKENQKGRIISDQQMAENSLTLTIRNQNFDLVSLYRLLMNTKRRVFQREKITNQIADHIVD